MIRMQYFNSYFHTFKSNLLVKKTSFLFNAAFVIAFLDLISQVHLA